MNPKAYGDLFRNAVILATGCFAAYYYTFRVTLGERFLDILLHGDHNAKKDRIRERGIIHVGADPAYHEPASWQVGREKWVERQDAEMDIIKEHIEQYNLKVGKHGYETPFDTYQA